jgi:hypothetical protein
MTAPNDPSHDPSTQPRSTDPTIWWPNPPVPPPSQPYDPNNPTGGGNFNPGMKIDTSHVSVAQPFKPGDNVGPFVSAPRRHPGPQEDPPPPPPPPSGPVVTLRAGNRGANGPAMEQFRRAVDAWMRDTLWETIDPATHHDTAKRVIGDMAGRYGLVIRRWETW